jgi:D-arabinose 1-dehydrogenase-like Zn-dependent alcohol dehydrogenase
MLRDVHALRGVLVAGTRAATPLSGGPHAAAQSAGGGLPVKAVRVHTPGGPDALRYEDVPEPTPKPGHAVVKVAAAGLNYIDVYYRSGLYKADFPMTLGMEAGGTVAAIGPNVTQVKVGDKVAYTGVQGSVRSTRSCPPTGSWCCRPASPRSTAPPPCCRA